MGLSDIVNVTISRTGRSVARAGFGVPMILGLNLPGPDLIKYYGDLDEVADDFLTSDAEYIAANRMFAQSPAPSRIAIGKRSANVAQVVTFTPNVSLQAIQDFEVTINGTLYSFESDADPTPAEVVTGLIALINAGSHPVTASGTTTLIVTADVAGQAFTYASSANMPGVLTTPNTSVTEALNAIVDLANGRDWYALMLTSRVEIDILNAAAWVETQRRIFVACSDAAAVITNSTSDVASQLQDLSYFRTAYLFSEDQDAFPDAAWLGRCLPTDPGSETWKFKTLVGIDADELTSSEEGFAQGKNANIYTEVAGVSITSEGVMAGGEFIDVVRFIDFLTARIEENVYSAMINVDKIPFTDGGIAVIENEIKAVLANGVAVGGLSADPAPEVVVPKAADVLPADKAARRLTGVTFTGTLAGAIHATVIRGTLSV